jgi:hypothetical protein
MAIHFETLWEQCEQLHLSKEDPSIIIDELIMKLNLYKVIHKKTEIPKKDYINLKSHTLGEILFTITKLSLIEDINVFESLNTVKQVRDEQLITSIPDHLKLP